MNTIIEQINNLSESELIELNNIYAQSIGSEDEIYGNDEDFFDTFFIGNANGALRAAHFGTYNWSHEYVKFNGYGNLESFDSFTVKDLCECVETIAEYATENQSEFETILDF
jgi:hypothetical protein